MCFPMLRTSSTRSGRLTGKPEVKSRPNSQLRGREVGFGEIAIDVPQARLNEAALRRTLSRVSCQRCV